MTRHSIRAAAGFRTLAPVPVLAVISDRSAAQTASTWKGASGNWITTADWSTQNYPNNDNGASPLRCDHRRWHGHALAVCRGRPVGAGVD
jgi:hypothetical protein